MIETPLARSLPPVDVEVLGQIARHVLSASIGHPAGVENLAHVRVDERNARAAGYEEKSRSVIIGCVRARRYFSTLRTELDRVSTCTVLRAGLDRRRDVFRISAQ